MTRLASQRREVRPDVLSDAVNKHVEAQLGARLAPLRRVDDWPQVAGARHAQQAWGGTGTGMGFKRRWGWGIWPGGAGAGMGGPLVPVTPRMPGAGVGQVQTQARGGVWVGRVLTQARVCVGGGGVAWRGWLRGE